MIVGGHGSSGSLAFGFFFCIVLLFFVYCHVTCLCSRILLPEVHCFRCEIYGFPWRPQFFLFTLVDCLWSFLKHGCTPYVTFTTSYMLSQVHASAAPATSMPSNHHQKVWGWHLSSISTLFGHLGHEKGFNIFHLRINIYLNIVKHFTFDNWH